MLFLVRFSLMYQLFLRSLNSSVGADYNGHMEQGIFALFLHEDILARVYQYEMDVIIYRQAKLRLGLGDPGRPPYKEAYPVCLRLHLFFCLIVNNGPLDGY